MASADGAAARPVVIEAGGPSLGETVVELWDARELLQTLVARELRIRYAQTWVGVAWVALKLLVTMALLWAIFGVVRTCQVTACPGRSSSSPA